MANAFLMTDPAAAPRLRLLCVPYAGGSAAMYRSWGRLMPPGISVDPLRLPGREHRLREPPYRAMAPLIDDLWDALAPSLKATPYAVFGHSMGAAIAWQLTQRAVRENLPPRHLFVSGRRPPSAPPPHPPMFALAEDRLIAEIERRYGPMPPALTARPSLLRAFLPTLRADMQLIDTWVADPAPVPVPITAYGGHTDPTLSRELLLGWQDATLRRFELHLTPGGHFHARDEPHVRDHVAQTLHHVLAER